LISVVGTNAEERIMRMIANTLVALGFVGTMAVGASSPTLAQGFYVQGPGFGFGIGRPYYRDRYDYGYTYGRSYYDRPYVYEGRRDYWIDRRDGNRDTDDDDD